MSERVPAIVDGGGGYVAGELLRILAAHPVFDVIAVLSASRAEEAVESVFPHLSGSYRGRVFTPRSELERALPKQEPVAVFSAGPHGESARQIDALLETAAKQRAEVRVVDLSADFRFPDPADYERIYGPHGAPKRAGEFHCSLPEHGPARLRRHVCHPGCFTTSVVLPGVPLLASGFVRPVLRVSSVTGSTGAGKTPTPTTHFPERAANLFGYQPLRHRHQAEMERLIGEASGERVEVRFVPHSGPFARGIHTTIHADLVAPCAVEVIAAEIAEFYAEAPFVSLVASPPRVKEVAGTNHCRIGVAVDGRALVVFSVIDNLVKGAAGGAVQWMNRLFELPDETGLELPGLGWY